MKFLYVINSISLSYHRKLVVENVHYTAMKLECVIRKIDIHMKPTIEGILGWILPTEGLGHLKDEEFRQQRTVQGQQRGIPIKKAV